MSKLSHLIFRMVNSNSRNKWEQLTSAIPSKNHSKRFAIVSFLKTGLMSFLNRPVQGSAKISALQVARGRGTVLLVGTAHTSLTFTGPQFEAITRKELNVVGSWMSYSALFPGEEEHGCLDDERGLN